MTYKYKIILSFFLAIICSCSSHAMNSSVKGLLPFSMSSMMAPVLSPIKPFDIKRFCYTSPLQKHHVYGIATYDALFKYVLSQKSVQPSFFRTFLPGIPVKSIERLDEHMNPIQSFQHLRNIFTGEEVATTITKLKKSKGLSVHTKEKPKSALIINDEATKFLTQVVQHFDDFQNLIPKHEYDGTMDFVCELDNGDYALVEMQAVPQNHWDDRALAYVAAFYGNQLRKGDKWHDLKKVIGINILGGGKDALQHWGETPEQFIRHYKMTEQKHTPSRFMNGIEIIQYSLMNAPKTFDFEGLKDWITFFRDGSTMSEDDVKITIKTQAVLDAFKFSKLTSLPKKVKEQYEKDEKRYDQYSDHTAKAIEKGRQEGEARGQLNKAMDVARKMIIKGKTTAEILDLIEDLTPAQIESLRQDIRVEQAKKRDRDDTPDNNQPGSDRKPRQPSDDRR